MSEGPNLRHSHWIAGSPRRRDRACKKNRSEKIPLSSRSKHTVADEQIFALIPDLPGVGEFAGSAGSAQGHARQGRARKTITSAAEQEEPNKALPKIYVWP